LSEQQPSCAPVLVHCSKTLSPCASLGGPSGSCPLVAHKEDFPGHHREWSDSLVDAPPWLAPNADFARHGCSMISLRAHERRSIRFCLRGNRPLVGRPVRASGPCGPGHSADQTAISPFPSTPWVVLVGPEGLYGAINLGCGISCHSMSPLRWRLYKGLNRTNWFRMEPVSPIFARSSGCRAGLWLAPHDHPESERPGPVPGGGASRDAHGIPPL